MESVEQLPGTENVNSKCLNKPHSLKSPTTLRSTVLINPKWMKVHTISCYHEMAGLNERMFKNL